MRTLNDRTDPKKFLENYRNPLTNYILYAIMYIVNELPLKEREQNGSKIHLSYRLLREQKI